MSQPQPSSLIQFIVAKRKRKPSSTPGGDHQSPADLGVPTHVFVDTSVFESLNFAFGGTLLQALANACRAGEIALLLPDVTRREVLARMRKAVLDAKAAAGAFRKESKILRGVRPDTASQLASDTEWEAIHEEINASWQKFQTQCDATILQSKSADVERIIDDYFGEKPPFGSGDKKNEFPDAFALGALRAFALAKGCKIAVVSLDQDQTSACAADQVMVASRDLKKVLEHTARLGEMGPDKVRKLLAEHSSELEAAIAASFSDRGFYWDSEEAFDSEVVETSEVEVESLDLSVLGTVAGWADLAGDATLTFKAEATYPDPEHGYYDSEASEWHSFGTVDAMITASSTVPVTFQLNVHKLRAGKLEFRSLKVNNDEDVWFSAYEIEELHRSDDAEGPD